MSYESSKIGKPWKGYYLTAYGIAVKHGFKGTEEDWLESLIGQKGDGVEMRYDTESDVLQWKNEAETQWQTLLTLEDIQGQVILETEDTIKEARDAAENAKNSAAIYAAQAELYADSAESAKSAAENAKNAAENAADVAMAAKTAAALSETVAAESAAEAAEAVEKAANSAASAAVSENNALKSEITSTTAQIAAETASENAVAAAERAMNSAEVAVESESGALSSKNAAADSAKNAADSAKNAADSAKNAADSAEVAIDSAEAAENAQQAAQISENSSLVFANAAAESKENAAASATEAESWAVGGTGTRVGENTNNAKYWSEQAAAVVGGDYATYMYVDGKDSDTLQAAKSYTDGKSAEILDGSKTYTDEQIAAIPKADLTDYVKNTDYAEASKGGVVKIGVGGRGLAMSNGEMYIVKAPDMRIESKEDSYCPIVPSNLDHAVKVGITTNKETLTDEERIAVRSWLDAVGNTDYANGAVKYGLVKSAGTGYGVSISSTGMVSVVSATEDIINAKSNNYQPIVPATLDHAVKVGLTTNIESLTDSEKTAVRAWMGAEEIGIAVSSVSSHDSDNTAHADIRQTVLNAQNAAAQAQQTADSKEDIGTAANIISEHNASTATHSDIRNLITPITIDQANIEAGSASTEPEGSLHFIYS